jgi:hypothetical protein
VIRLTQVLDYFYCGAAKTDVLEDQVAFCKHFGGLAVRVPDAEVMTRYEHDRRVLTTQLRLAPARQQKDGFKFTFGGREFLGDLYAPGCSVDKDRVAHFTFPGTGWGFVPTSQLGFDWRYLLMAWPIWANVPKGTVRALFHLRYASGHVVDAEVEADTWHAVESSIQGYRADVPYRETAGRICGRCSRRDACSVYTRFIDNNLVPEVQAGEDKKNRAHRTVIERTALRMRLELLRKRERELTSQLKSLLTEREFIINGAIKVTTEHRTTIEWTDIQRVFEVLSRAGLWSWNLVKPNTQEIRDAIPGLPDKIQVAMKALSKEVHHEGSIQEALSGAEHDIRDAVFRAIT